MGLFQFCAGNGTRWICNKLDLANLDLWTLLKDGDCHLEYHIPDTPLEDQEDPLKYTLQRTLLCVSFYNYGSNNNRLIISCVFMWLTSHDIFSFQLIFLSAHRSLDYNKDRSIDRSWLGFSELWFSVAHSYLTLIRELTNSWHLNWINKFKLQRNAPSRTALGALDTKMLRIQGKGDNVPQRNECQMAS